MAAPTETSKQTTTDSGPESPTTVKPFEMDDDDVQDTPTLDSTEAKSASAPTAANPSAAGVSSPTASATTNPITTTEQVPSKPPRPVTEQQKNELMLKEAFPSIDINVIRAVLTASNGRIDPAFNALLGMSDPDAVQNEPVREEAAPPRPPRPSGRAPMSQLEADELYARQLAQQYENVGDYEARTQNRGAGPRRQATGLKPDEMYDREHSFIDDDLPVIKENLRKGFLDTQKQVNTWFTNLKKKIDDAYDEDEDESQPSKHQHGRRSGEGSRRSADYDRYDADPQVLGDDFAGMRLNPDGTPVQGHPGSRRPPQPSVSPKPGGGRKVAFKDGAEDIDVYGASPRVPPKDGSAPTSAGKQSKWQPLSTVEPSPIADNDPFSLGDSEDERDAKAGIKMEDSERLKQATADAMSDSLVDKKGTSESAKKD
jgi:hypothetical protein